MRVLAAAQTGQPALGSAERGTRLSHGLWVRQVRRLSKTGHQTAILSTSYQADHTRLAAWMFARWSQENFFRYMREHYGLDRLVEYGTEPIPKTVRVVDPAWRKLDSQRRTLPGQRQRLLARFAALEFEGESSEALVSAMNSTLPRPCSQARTCASFTKLAHVNLLGGQDVLSKTFSL
jgi:hypothetical protein